MKETETRRTSTEKVCRECGSPIVEKHESSLYECERCIGRHEE